MGFFVIGSYMNANFMSVPHLPIEGESLAATSMWTEHGGKGLNLAVGLHRLGASVDLLLAVGEDEAGNAVRERLRSEGLRMRWVMQFRERSGYGVGFVGPEGENFLAAFSGANALLSQTHVEEAMTSLANLSWVCAQFEAPIASITKAFELAKSRGMRTYLNPSPWRPFPETLLALTDILVINVVEAAGLFKTPSVLDWTFDQWAAELSILAERLDWRGELLVITLGDQGALALSRSGEVTFQPAWPINQVDATGAGDAFGCGLLWALHENLPLTEVLQTANACGAIVAGKTGAWQALPDLSELEAFKCQGRVAGL